MQQQAAHRSWRAWLEENTTSGAAKVHQLIREPIGFQVARGNAVDEQLELRETWTAIWRANAVEPALVWPEDNGPLFQRPPTDAIQWRVNNLTLWDIFVSMRGRVEGSRSKFAVDASLQRASGIFAVTFLASLPQCPSDFKDREGIGHFWRT